MARETLLALGEVLEYLPVPSAIIRGDGLIEDANALFASLAGDDVPTLRGKDWLAFWAAEVGQASPERPWLDAVRQNAFVLETIFGPANAPRRLVRWRGKRLPPADDGQARFLVTGRDITDFRDYVGGKAVKLAQVVELVKELVVIADAHGNVLYANPAFLAATGYGLSEVVGHKAISFISVPEDASLVRELLAALQSSRPWEGQMTLGRKDGGVVEVQAVMAPSCDSQGRVVQYSCVCLDITRERQLQRQLQQVQKMDALGHLANGIAHSFNNILAGIAGQTELLTLGLGKPASIEERAQKILKATNRGRDLVQQLMGFCKRAEPQLRPVDVSHIVRHAVRFIGELAPANVTITCNAPERAPKVLAVAEDINQVLLNLMNNGIEAMRERGGTLSLEVALEHREPTPGSLALRRRVPWLRLTVRDTGRGIDPDIRDQIFEPFFTTRGLSEASGMGLAVVHGIVKRHGALIEVESEVGKGSAFHLYFPVLDPEIVEEKPEPPPRGKGERVLLTDEQAFVVEAGTSFLTELGYTAEGFTDAEAALEAVRAAPAQFAAAIVFYGMPHLDGLEWVRRARLHGFAGPIILTCAPGHRERVQAEGAGLAARVLAKPCAAAEIASALRHALDSTPTHHA